MSKQRIKVVNPKDGWLGTEYYIGGQKIDSVKSVDFRVAVDEMPVFTFETIGLPDIDMSGDVFFSFTPDTVQQAVAVLQNEFKNNRDSRNALVASITSTLREMPKEMGMYDVAELIANSIVGIEDEKAV